MDCNITYEWINNEKVAVFLDGKRCGKIEKTHLGFIYFPYGSKICGEPYETMDECKKSLEDS